MNPNRSEEYKQRLTARRETVERCRKLDRMLDIVRMAAWITFFALLWMALRQNLIPVWIALTPILIFLGIAIARSRIETRERRAQRSVAFYERGLARIEDRWMGGPASSGSFASETHLYATALDIFGKDSLFELISTARTRAGEEKLAKWLSAPAPTSEIVMRQQCVEELRGNIDLREALAVLGPEMRARVHPELLTRWGLAPTVLQSPAARVIAPIIAVFVYYTEIDFWFVNGSPWLAIIALVLAGAFGMYYRSRVREVIESVEQPERELEIISVVLGRLELEQFKSPRLQELRRALDTQGHPPSKQIGRLIRRIDMLNSRLNHAFTLLGNLMLWSTQFTFAIEAWRRDCGPALGRWIDAIGEFEALCSLAGYAYEHPEDPFPEIVEDRTCFEGDELRHPLLPRDRAVPNTVRLAQDLQLLVVSGSNMSGKSTLLRTVGVNVALALAGAPVRAKHLRLSQLAMGATLRVQDSLQDGTSQFYAEILRLRGIMELTEGPLAVLFLLDEILHGTNSHDRAIGAEAVVKSLVDRGAIGLVTTHDLALAKVADGLAPRAANVHFQDHLESGKMVFDYQLHPGVVQKSNALELMRAVGLKV